MDKYDRNGEGWKLDQENKAFYSHIEQKTGLTDVTYGTIGSLYDTILIQVPSLKQLRVLIHD
jgi:hypothetical protein